MPVWHHVQCLLTPSLQYLLLIHKYWDLGAVPKTLRHPQVMITSIRYGCVTYIPYKPYLYTDTIEPHTHHTSS